MVPMDRSDARPTAVVGADAGAGRVWCTCCCEQRQRRLAAWRGWLFATAWLACTFGWLFTSMHTYGGLAAPLAVSGGAGAGRLCWRSTTRLPVRVFRRLAPFIRLRPALFFCSLVAAGRAGARDVVDRLWLGRGWLRAGGRAAGAAALPWVGVYGISFVAGRAGGGAAGAGVGWPRWQGRWREASAPCFGAAGAVAGAAVAACATGRLSGVPERDPAAGQYSPERKV